MNVFAPMEAELGRLHRAVGRIPGFAWGVVTATSPLRVRPDFALMPLDGTPSTIATVAVGDRVLYASFGRRIVVLGKAGGGDPVGTVTMFAGDTPPVGKLICDGSSLLVADYPRLHAVVGYKYGGSGSSFLLPDMRERAPVGVLSGSSEFGTLGQKFGAKTHTLTEAQMPVHSHRQVVTAPTGPGPGIRTSWTGDAESAPYDQGVNTNPAGGGAAHNNIQPSFAIHFVIQT